MHPPGKPRRQTHIGLHIAERLTSHLEQTRINRVYYAENQTPPPQLAFLVHFPRLSVTLNGQDSYFCRVFRHGTKLTSTEYRQKSAQEKD